MIRLGRLYVVLLIMLLAVIGALLHPLALLLSVLPIDTKHIVSFLDGAKSLIADLLGWGLVSLLIVMATFIIKGRVAKQHRVAEPRSQVGRPIPAVAVAITAYNDGEATADAVRQFRAQESVLDILVIDNNCTDRTAELAAAAGARVIREHRQGYGFACIRGLWESCRISNADIIVLTEGDGTFVAQDLPKFLAYIDQADMVIGTRVVRPLVEHGSQMDYFFTWGNIAVAMLLRLRFWDSQFLGAAGLSDVGCTYRAIRREALERILPDLVVGSNHFSPHMMLVALARGLSIIEIPITFRRRIGLSKGASQSLWKGLVVGLAMIWHIITYRPLPPSSPARLPADIALEIGKP